MFFRFLMLILGGVLLILWQISLAALLLFPFSSVNLILIVLLLFFFIGHRIKSVIFLIFWVGFLLDLFSSAFFGIYLLSLFLTFLAINWLANYFFTNRTQLAFLALNFLAFLIFRLLFFSFNFFSNLKFSTVNYYSPKFYVVNSLQEIFFSLLVLIFLYALIGRFPKRTKIEPLNHF